MDLLTNGISQTLFSATTVQPSHLDSLANNALSRGIDLYMRQDFKGAAKEFQRSIGLAPNASNSVDAASYMADAYLALDDTKGAAKAYQTALRLNPYRDDIHIKLGNLYFSDDRYADAAAEYEKAVKLKPQLGQHLCSGAGVYELRAVYGCRSSIQQSDADGAPQTDR